MALLQKRPVFVGRLLIVAFRYNVGWLRLVGSLQTQVSFAKEPYKQKTIFCKRDVSPHMIPECIMPLISSRRNLCACTLVREFNTYNSLQLAATLCNTHCNTFDVGVLIQFMQLTATPCNTHCNNSHVGVCIHVCYVCVYFGEGDGR